MRPAANGRTSPSRSTNGSLDDFTRAQSSGERPGARTTFLRFDDVSPEIRVPGVGAPPMPAGAVRRLVLGGGMSDDDDDEVAVAWDCDCGCMLLDGGGMDGGESSTDRSDCDFVVARGGESRTDRRGCAGLDGPDTLNVGAGAACDLPPPPLLPIAICAEPGIGNAGGRSGSCVDAMSVAWASQRIDDIMVLCL